MSTQGLSERFAYHPPKDKSVADRHEDVRLMCRILAERLDDIMPPSREASLALTACQETMMWANAAIAIHGNAQ